MIYKGSTLDYDNVLSNMIQYIVANSSWELVSTYNTNDKIYPLPATHVYNSPSNALNLNYSSYSTLKDDPYWGKEGSDGYVLKSIPLGKYKRRIYVRFKYLDKCFYYTTSNATTSSGSMWDYSSPIILIQVMENFTPGVNNTTRGTVSERKLNYYSASLSNVFKSGEVNFLLNVEDNYISMCFEKNDSIPNYKYNSFFYIGYPEASSVVETETLNPITLVGNNVNFDTTTSSNYAYIFSESANKATGTFATLTNDLSPYNPSASGIYTMSKINLMRSGIFLGDLDGVFALPNSNISNSDIILKDGKKYQVYHTDLGNKKTYTNYSNTNNDFYTGASTLAWKNMFPSIYVAMRIE